MTKPKTGVAEWAPSSCNIQTGCEHGCKYCYAREMAVRFKRATIESWTVPVIQQAKVDKGRGRKRPQNQPIMFPTTHDITERNLSECLTVLKKLLRAGNRVLVVSKMGCRTQPTLAKDLRRWQQQLMFRITIGTYGETTASIWEPGAPRPQQRFDAAVWMMRLGYRVSISAEPFLGCPGYGAAVSAVRLYNGVADASNGPIWFGPMNEIAARVHGVPQDEVDRLVKLGQPETLRKIYEALKDRPRVRFKDGFTKVIDMPPQTDDWPDLPEVNHD